LGTVCTYFEKKYKKIILIGHSLGTLVILLSNLSAIAKIILWDPTTGFKDVREKNAYFNKKLNAYIFNWGKAIIVSKQMVEEWQKLKTEDLVKKITIPCKFIFAGNEDKYKSWKPFLRRAKLVDKISVIKGASHTFTEENVENKLFVETLKSIQ
jgi:pimeloyl-ACP methyl ester carboxylesterase